MRTARAGMANERPGRKQKCYRLDRTGRETGHGARGGGSKRARVSEPSQSNMSRAGPHTLPRHIRLTCCGSGGGGRATGVGT
eukprot:7378958-Prymnesium_polylepis.2